MAVASKISSSDGGATLPVKGQQGAHRRLKYNRFQNLQGFSPV
jgi:hypothetical protein